MLVLSRKIDEVIKVGDITITVVETGKRSVRLGIAAPPTTPILRGEFCGMPAKSSYKSTVLKVVKSGDTDPETANPLEESIRA